MMSLRARVLEEVEALQDELVDFLVELVRVPTVNPPGEAYEDCARLIGERLARSGFAIEYHPAEGRPERARRSLRPDSG